ncbi:topoisomerase DNA-binding C4 zinc finger domain-containing protein [Shigella flexneri]
MAKSALFTVRNNESCRKCGAELVILFRETRSVFLGCSQYPARDYVLSLKSSADGHIVKVLEGQVCPACGANLVLRQGRFVCLLVAVTTLMC